MNKVLATTTVALLLSSVRAQSDSTLTERVSCVTKNQDLQGYPSSGQAFSDWDYLVSHESSDYIYRLNGVQLCTDDEGHLRGMEAFVGKYSTVHENSRLISTLAMNKVGDVSGACKTLQVDPLQNEFIQRIIFRAGDDFVDAIWIGANNKKDVIFNGNHPAKFTDKVFDFTAENPFIGFWGTATLGEWIYSVGTVSVQTDCQIGYDPSVIPIEDINENDSGQTNQNAYPGQNSDTSLASKWHNQTGLDTETTIFVAAATTTILVLATALCLGIAAHMRNKTKDDSDQLSNNQEEEDYQHQNNNQNNQNNQNNRSGDTRSQQTQNTVEEMISNDKRQSVKKVNGQVQIHQELNQHSGTEIQITEDIESGRGTIMQGDNETERNFSQVEIEQSEDVISAVDLTGGVREPNRQKTFKVVR